MAAISPAHGDPTALTPPSSSHGDEASWGYPRTMEDGDGMPNFDHDRNPTHEQNGKQSDPFANTFAAKARKMHSADNLYSSKWDKAVDNGVLSPPQNAEAKIGRSTPADWSFSNNRNSSDDLSRPSQEQSDPNMGTDDSKWIHRDKLAKIESEELQAAGIYIPRSRAPSKHRKERTSRRDTDASEQSQNRPMNDSAIESAEASPMWDLRTPEEIAQEQENAYFVSHGHGAKGGSRIPVAKVSPSPITSDYLSRATQGARHTGDSPESQHELISNPKMRSRSASATLREPAPAAPATTLPRPGQRSVTEASPKKTSTGPRKTSASSKASTTNGRPKTRSGPNKDSSAGARPQTRSGEPNSTHKQPEGDPPWLANSYKPDPRLPPEQQIIPTVARRLQQEKWEKEGKFGDIYDTEFRPLNDHQLLHLSGTENGAQGEASQDPSQEQQQSSEWPLKAEPTKSPTMRQGSSYSTMPKISDMPPKSPLSSHRNGINSHGPTESQSQTKEAVEPPQRVPTLPEEQEKKDGCGCCVVM